jgi:tight adherence protein B
MSATAAVLVTCLAVAGALAAPGGWSRHRARRRLASARPDSAADGRRGGDAATDGPRHAAPGTSANPGAGTVLRLDAPAADGRPFRASPATSSARAPGWRGSTGWASRGPLTPPGPDGSPHHRGDDVPGWSPAGGATAWWSARGLVLAGLAAVALGAVGGPALLAAAVVAGGLVGWAWWRYQVGLPARQRRAQLPGALDRLAAALRGGESIPAALATAGADVPAPLGPELAELGRQADGGTAVVDVLDRWAERRDDPATRLAATALVLASAVGAAPARAADGVAATLRERADLAEERRALGAQARMSAVVLSVAPVGFALLLGATDRAATRFLLASPAGWACLAAGTGLDAAGAYWMAQLTRGDAR